MEPTTALTPTGKPMNVQGVIWLLAAVQCINVLEFMIVMPLGPDFAAALSIPPSHIGYIGGSYTAAASFAGLASSVFIERFDRKRALLFAIMGLILSTVLAGFALSFEMLLSARVLAGFFGGPATSLSLSIVSDLVPFEKRGRAMGIVMSSFSIASIVGVPLGLELARWGGWRVPLFAIAGLGVIVWCMALILLPSLRGHLNRRMGQVPVALIKQFADLLRRGRVWLSFLLGMSIMMGIFMVIPSLAPYILGNLKFPREQFGMLYFVGGVCTFGGSFLVGRLVDRFGAILIGSLGSLWLAVSMYMLMVHPLGYYGIVAWFAAFMMSSSFRSVPYQTLISKVPHPSQRAQFMSLQSTVAHLSSASGAFLASLILSENAEGALVHVEVLVYVAITISLTSPLLMYLVGRRETPAA